MEANFLIFVKLLIALTHKAHFTLLKLLVNFNTDITKQQD